MDLMATVLCVPFGVVVLIAGRWIFGNALCSMVAYVSCLLLTVSIITLAAMSISRYFLITSLLRYMNVFKKQNTTWMIVLIWSFAALYAFPPFLG